MTSNLNLNEISVLYLSSSEAQSESFDGYVQNFLDNNGSLTVDHQGSTYSIFKQNNQYVAYDSTGQLVDESVQINTNHVESGFIEINGLKGLKVNETLVIGQLPNQNKISTFSINPGEDLNDIALTKTPGYVSSSNSFDPTTIGTITLNIKTQFANGNTQAAQDTLLQLPPEQRQAVITNLKESGPAQLVKELETAHTEQLKQEQTQRIEVELKTEEIKTQFANGNSQAAQDTLLQLPPEQRQAVITNLKENGPAQLIKELETAHAEQLTQEQTQRIEVELKTEEIKTQFANGNSQAAKDTLLQLPPEQRQAVITNLKKSGPAQLVKELETAHTEQVEQEKKNQHDASIQEIRTHYDNGDKQAAKDTFLQLPAEQRQEVLSTFKESGDQELLKELELVHAKQVEAEQALHMQVDAKLKEIQTHFNNGNIQAAKEVFSQLPPGKREQILDELQGTDSTELSNTLKTAHIQQLEFERTHQVKLENTIQKIKADYQNGNTKEALDRFLSLTYKERQVVLNRLKDFETDQKDTMQKVQLEGNLLGTLEAQNRERASLEPTLNKIQADFMANKLEEALNRFLSLGLSQRQLALDIIRDMSQSQSRTQQEQRVQGGLLTLLSSKAEAKLMLAPLVSKLQADFLNNKLDSALERFFSLNMGQQELSLSILENLKQVQGEGIEKQKMQEGVVTLINYKNELEIIVAPVLESITTDVLNGHNDTAYERFVSLNAPERQTALELMRNIKELTNQIHVFQTLHNDLLISVIKHNQDHIETTSSRAGDPITDDSIEFSNLYAINDAKVRATPGQESLRTILSEEEPMRPGTVSTKKDEDSLSIILKKEKENLNLIKTLQVAHDISILSDGSEKAQQKPGEEISPTAY